MRAHTSFAKKYGQSYSEVHLLRFHRVIFFLQLDNGKTTLEERHNNFCCILTATTVPINLAKAPQQMNQRHLL